MKSRIVIWGAGKQGRDAYYHLNRRYDIEGFLDSDITKTGIEVVDHKKVLADQGQRFFIVIACQKWMEVSNVLLNRGLKFLNDFIPYNMLIKKHICLHNLIDCFDISDIIEYLSRIKETKKLALIYGNCQTEIIANMLEYNVEFNRQYVLLRVPQIHLYRNEEQIEQIFYKSNIMQKMDLFIYQRVNENNRFHSKLGTENILKQFNNNIKSLAIHNIYFDGYFPQYDANDERYFRNLNKKDFPYTDGIVDLMIKEKKSSDEIVTLISSEDLLSEKEVKEKCEQSISNLREREKIVDVPIVDYIEENYCNEQLFYTYNHPKNIVIYEYVKRLLKCLGIEKNDEFTEEELNIEFGTLRINNFPIFPCVIKALGLKKYEKKVRISHISTNLITIEDYIREYIYRCYGVIESRGTNGQEYFNNRS